MIITTSNFKEVLIHIGFEPLKGKDKDVWLKSYPTCDLRVDFKNNLLIYPEDKGLVVNERQTCNFSASENFVVFECVNRLLSKGYKPEHIELEPKWKLGHGASGGRADILIRDNSGNALLIIECKTWGEEFEAEWKNMNLNGGQLFSYAQQIKSTQFLCLYTSGLVDGTIVYKNNIITLNDNKEYLKTLKEPLAFADATDVQTLYKAWYVTYNHEYETTGIFEDAHPAYEIGKAKRTVSDLKDLNHDDIQKKYHEFATILRQHNVSGRENAFDKLVNLFLAKIVDEMQNPDELMFYWRGVAFDNYYDLQDRIQRLYRDGMQKFLNEEVTYIDNEDIKRAFRLFKNDPDATRDQIEEYFRQLKFYTNNDFAFLDVHNQHLFLQNSVILLKIVRMIQDIKLKTDEQNQFLGDLFEGFLDQGVKQSEGQFFTPIPIVKFLVSSLPLKTLIEGSTEPLNVIDYACGAGHFLNEYATQIRDYVSPEQLPEYYGRIVGIEKEYRLSKVAKVSAFMYGQDEIQIIYADALAENPVIKNGVYDILISNPPYSVKGFLETLTPEERAAYEIFKAIDSKSIYSNNAIEVFFVERAKQLLAPGGVAAIILPSSLLSNSGSVYTKAREIILQYFDIVAIIEFGSGTFGKTGTNTVTLFLRRKEENPALAEHYRNRVNAWFNGDFEKDGVFADANLLNAYCQHMGYDLNEYKTLLNSIPCDALLEWGEFKAYRTAFDNLAETKNRKNQKTFKALKADEQQAELMKRFTLYIREIEKDKLYYFMLAYSNPQNVVVVKCPSGTNESKRFLGYEWSNRKGAEGIKYIGVVTNDENEDETLSRLKGIKSIQTPLFNPTDLSDMTKINSIIRANFNGEPISESEYVKLYRLVDMLDFTGVKFEKQITLTAKGIVKLESKYPLVPLSKLADISRGASPRPISQYLTTANDGVNWIKIGDAAIGEKYITSTKEKITPEGAKKSKAVKEGDLIISNSMSAGRPYILKISGCIHDGWLLLSNISKDIDKEYLYYVLTSNTIQELLLSKSLGGVVQNLNTTRVSSVEIPLPPLDIQHEIVVACEALDAEYQHINISIEEYYDKIEQLFNDMESIASISYSLSDSRIFDLSIGKRVLNTQLIPDGEVPVYSANVFEPFGYINERLITDFDIPSVLWGIDGDWQVNYMPDGIEFYPTDHCGVLRVLTEDVHPRCLAWVLNKAGKERGFSRSLRASIDRVKRLTVQLPSIDKQREVADKVIEYERIIAEMKLKFTELYKERQKVLDEHLR